MKMKIAVGVLFILGCLILLGDDPVDELTNLEFVMIKFLGLLSATVGGFVLLVANNKKIYVDYCRVNRRY